MKKYHLIPVLLIIVLACLLYANTLDNEFVYNDFQMVGENSFIRSWDNIRYFGSEKYFTGSRENTFRPVVTVTFLADHSIWGENTFGYHLTNMTTHILNGLLLYLIVTILAGPPRGNDPGQRANVPRSRMFPVALVSALFFIAHPVMTEGVISIGSRHDLVMTFFYLLSVYMYLRSGGRRSARNLCFYAGSLCAYFLSMLSKEMGATVPFMLIAADAFRKDRVCGGDEGRLNGFIRDIRYYLPYALVLFAYLYLRFFVMIHPSETIGQMYDPEAFFGGSVRTHIMTVISIFGGYLRILAAPVKLSLEYIVTPAVSFAEPSVILPTLAVCAIFASVVWCRRRYPLVSFGWIWFFIAILPVSNLVIMLLSTRMSERFLYLPAAGYCMVLSAVFAGICQVPGIRARKYGDLTVYVLVAAVLTAYSVRTLHRNTQWQNSRVFWESAEKDESRSFRTHNNLAMVYFYEGDPDKAIKELKTSLDLLESAHTRVNLGFVYMEQGRYADAEKEFRKAIADDLSYAPAYYHLSLLELKNGRPRRALETLDTALAMYARSKERPFYAETYNAKGMALLMTGEAEKAEEPFLQAVNLMPEYSEARYNLARSYFLGKKYDSSAAQCLEILDLDPGNIPARYLLAQIYARQGKLEDSMNEYKAVLRAYPGNVDARSGMAGVLYSLGDDGAAVEEYLKVLSAAPDHFVARTNLSGIYLENGKYEEASEGYEAALRMRPDNVIVLYNLGLAYEGKGMIGEAARMWEKALELDPGFAPARKALYGIREGE